MRLLMIRSKDRCSDTLSEKDELGAPWSSVLAGCAGLPTRGRAGRREGN